MPRGSKMIVLEAATNWLTHLNNEHDECYKEGNYDLANACKANAKILMAAIKEESK